MFSEEELAFDAAPIFDAAGQVERPGLTIHFPVAGVRAKIASEDGSGLRFEHPQYPDWSITTYDRQAIRQARSLIPIAERSDGGPAASRPWPWFVAPLLLLGGTIASVWLIVLALGTAHDLMMSAVLRLVPISVERRLGDAMVAQMGGAVVRDERLRGQLRSVARSLLSEMKERGHDIRLELVIDESLNAASLPGDIIVVNSGLISGVTDERELLGVLGHECAHVLERHSTQQLATSIGLSVITMLVVGDVDVLTAEAARIGPFLLSQGFARAQEEEADRTGAALLEAAQLDPNGLVQFLKRIEQIQPEDSSLLGKASQFVSTHPVTRERIEVLEEEIAGLGPAPEPRQQAEFIELQRHLSELEVAYRLSSPKDAR